MGNVGRSVFEGSPTRGTARWDISASAVSFLTVSLFSALTPQLYGKTIPKLLGVPSLKD